MATMLTLALAAAMTTSAVYAANPNTDDPSFAGQVTSNRAQLEGSDFGAHASDPTGTGPSGDQTGRNGLANALTDRGEPQHPSEVIGFLCTIPNTPGCP